MMTYQWRRLLMTCVCFAKFMSVRNFQNALRDFALGLGLGKKLRDCAAHFTNCADWQIARNVLMSKAISSKRAYDETSGGGTSNFH